MWAWDGRGLRTVVRSQGDWDPKMGQEEGGSAGEATGVVRVWRRGGDWVSWGQLGWGAWTEIKGGGSVVLRGRTPVWPNLKPKSAPSNDLSNS